MTSRDRSHPHPPRVEQWPLRVALALAIVVLLGATACASTTDAANDDPDLIAPADQLEGLRRSPPLEVGAVSLPEIREDEPDRPFTMKASPGNLLFVYFGYTYCPDLCPTTMSDLRKALKLIGPDAARIETAFVTVDPQRDTVDVLPSYLRSFVSDAHALRTENPAELQGAEDAFLASSTITPLDDGTYSVSHTASSSIVDQNGIVVAEWPFGISPESMADDLRILLAEIPSPTGTTIASTGT